MPVNVGGNIISSTSLSGSSFNGEISSNNLKLYLDASNANSYAGSGTTWTDLSGNGNHGTLINGPTYSSGTFVLDGTDDYISVPYSQFNFNTSTIIYVAKLASTPNSRNTIFSQYYGGNGAQFEWGSDGGLRSNFRQNAAGTPENDAPNGGSQISTNTIYHVAVTYNTGGVIRHYKNGLFLGQSTNASQTDVNGGNVLTIGRNSSAGLNFKGTIYMFAIYNRVLHSAEIIANYYGLKNRFNI